MPTPYGSRGGLAFGAEELRVLRRALALALHPAPASADDVQDCLRLAESLDEALREGARLRAFLVADLGRYRAALPGTAAGYLALLDEALDAGYRPLPDDLAALRALRGNPAAAALLDRCTVAPLTAAPLPAATVPGSRTRLLALPGGRCASGGDSAGDGPEKQPEKKPVRKPPAPKPAPAPAPGTPKPSRPIPTPGEVFPRRKPAPPPPANPQQLAAG
ncbi:hypothetical protein ACFYN9_37605 [Streptomyces collinus]|uniref:Uncharacterized protein n=2 Tax=Streptomyces TaxID=1883 RepID=A0AA89QB51_STRCU|nr:MULTISPECIES: hypothetical protein [Streptomyces]MBB5812885.1 hypothetical protein [Streptomyces collinus]MEC7055775.1 hypothetical protein [Streptomyces violaceochromogenes]WMX66012.1 hypothetical protein RFN52_22715 [Streptomyces collinus]GHC75011.1 hypothetical protein GCM10010309_46440 [Streptomyces violaceochromogenes]